MRIGTNSRGPGGLIRRALRMSVLAGLMAFLMLAPGLMQACAQSHGRAGGSHFGGGGWHGGRADRAFGPRNGGFNASRNRGGFGRWQDHQERNRVGRNQGAANRGHENQNRVNRSPGNPGRGNIRGGSMQRSRSNVQGARGAGRFNAGSRFNNGARNGVRGARPKQFQRGNGARPAMRQVPNGPGAMRPEYHPQPNTGRNMPGIRPREGPAGNVRPGQEHLPQWWRAHQGLSPQQQADAMRREPGFRSLPREQQQRLLGRLRSFDSRPPQVQQRMLSRVEMFERLPPERQQEVRGASAAFNRMPQPRKQVMIRAFQQLRRMPPTEREEMLRSGYGQQFTPRERTILGNLLSIEPYAPSGSEPYFGRPHSP